MCKCADSLLIQNCWNVKILEIVQYATFKYSKEIDMKIGIFLSFVEITVYKASYIIRTSNPFAYLLSCTIRQITCIAQPGNDICLCGHLIVNSS